MPHGASFHEGPHCLLVPRRSSEIEKRISMLRRVRLRIYAYAHLNVRLAILTIPALPLTKFGNLRRVVCVCAVNRVQYAQTVKGNI